MSAPKIGVNVVVRKNGRVLFGQRKGGVGQGEWCLPGGKLDAFESLVSGAIREVREETGIELVDLVFVNLTNDPRQECNEHYIQVTFFANTDKDPKLTEPDSFSGWGWFSFENLPQPLFFGHRKLLQAIQSNRMFSD